MKFMYLTNKLPEIDIHYSGSKVIIPELDGIRGLAIILVIAHHCFRLTFGWVGVDLFFVLSGFLITGILLDTKSNENYYRNFWARRILRIFPLYYCVLILIFLPQTLFQLNIIGEPSITYWFYLQNLKFTFDGSFPQGKGPLNHFWSLAIEEQFYLIFPVIIKSLRPKMFLLTSAFFIISAIILRFYLYFNNNIGYYVFTFCRIDALLIGAILAYLIRNKKDLITKYIHYFFVFSLLILVFLFLTGTTKNSDKYLATFGYTIIAVFFATIIVYSISNFKLNFLKVFFNIKALKFFGKIAYGLYIYHYILYVLFKPAIETIIYSFIQNGYISKVLVSIILVTITVLISTLSYLLFEKRFLLLKNRFTK